MMSLAIFFLFFTPLVFFHELGHFLVAKWFGVKVEKFSIGIGPKIFGFIKGETEYVFSLFPLGGFIKMFGEDLLKREEVEISLRKRAYNHQSPWARFWIVLAGPLANIILAFSLFLFLIIKGQKLPEARFLAWKDHSSLSQMGFQLGDKLLQINEEKIQAFEQLLLIQKPLQKIIVERNNEEVELSLNISPGDFGKILKEELQPGIKPFVSNAMGKKILLDEKKSLQELEVSFKKTLTIEKKNISCTLSFWNCLKKEGYFPLELKIKNILIGEEGDKLGLKTEDIILQVQNQNVFNLNSLKNLIKDTKFLEILVLRTGEFVHLKGDFQGSRLGIETEIEYIEEEQVFVKAKSLPEAFLWAFEYTYRMTMTIIEALKDLLFKNFDLQQLGGPIAIGKMANKTFEMGLDLFLKFMAVFSVNLAIMNLLPIPVLDGGHIVILTIESLIRRPLPPKVIKVIFSLGFFLIIYLMLQGLFNDIKRSFFK